MEPRLRQMLLRAGVLTALAGVLFLGGILLHRAWVGHNQSRAIETLQQLTDALQAYHRKHNGYPDSLERLRGGEEGQPETAPAERARLLPAALAKDRFRKSGYLFRYEPLVADQRWAGTARLLLTYQLTAEPTRPGTTGKLFFYTDQSGKIRRKEGAAAGPDDPLARPQAAAEGPSYIHTRTVSV